MTRGVCPASSTDTGIPTDFRGQAHITSPRCSYSLQTPAQNDSVMVRFSQPSTARLQNNTDLLLLPVFRQEKTIHILGEKDQLYQPQLLNLLAHLIILLLSAHSPYVPYLCKHVCVHQYVILLSTFLDTFLEKQAKRL